MSSDIETRRGRHPGHDRVLVETGSEPLTWSSLQQAAEREGLLTPPAAPLATMLLGALGPR
jgi:hypothetical protein